VAAVLSGIANADYERKVATSAPTQKRAQGLRQRTADRIADKVAEKVEAGNGRLKDLRDLAVVLVARDRLMRASEVVSLTLAAVDATDPGTVTITFRRIKTRSDEKTFTLGPDAAAALADWLAALSRAGITAGPLFRSLGKGGRIKDTSISRKDVCRIVKDLAGSEYSAHSLRRGMAQDLRKDGKSVLQTMAAGGWSSDRMVSIYTDSEDTSDDAALDYHRRHARHK
jgi:integrase